MTLGKILTVLDLPRIRSDGGAESRVELLFDFGVLLKHGDEGVAQNAGQLALEMRPHVLQQTRSDQIYSCLELHNAECGYFHSRMSA